jgi:hypothetical protein
VGGGNSKSTERVGEGTGGLVDLLFEFSLALSLALRFTTPPSGVTLASGVAEAFALAD